MIVRQLSYIIKENYHEKIRPINRVLEQTTKNSSQRGNDYLPLPPDKME